MGLLQFMLLGGALGISLLWFGGITHSGVSVTIGTVLSFVCWKILEAEWKLLEGKKEELDKRSVGND